MFLDRTGALGSHGTFVFLVPGEEARLGHQRRLKIDFTGIALPVLSQRVAIFFFADDNPAPPTLRQVRAEFSSTLELGVPKHRARHEDSYASDSNIGAKARTMPTHSASSTRPRSTWLCRATGEVTDENLLPPGAKENGGLRVKAQSNLSARCSSHCKRRSTSMSASAAISRTMISEIA